MQNTNLHPSSAFLVQNMKQPNHSHFLVPNTDLSFAFILCKTWMTPTAFGCDPHLGMIHVCRQPLVSHLGIIRVCCQPLVPVWHFVDNFWVQTLIKLILGSSERWFKDLQLLFYDLLLIPILSLSKLSFKLKLLHSSNTPIPDSV